MDKVNRYREIVRGIIALRSDRVPDAGSEAVEEVSDFAKQTLQVGEVGSNRKLTASNWLRVWHERLRHFATGPGEGGSITHAPVARTIPDLDGVER